MGKLIDISGGKFGKLTVINFYEIKDRYAYWLCMCECGNQVITKGSNLKTGDTKSCGCLSTNFKHGMKHTRQYLTWSSMKNRCLNVNNQSYANYGERGITVCDEWLTFEGFWKDMSVGYDGNLTLERKDNSKGYCAENCKWATIKEQNNNKRSSIIISYNGVAKSLKQWAIDLSMNYQTLFTRFHSGWSIQRLIETPAIKGGNWHD